MADRQFAVTKPDGSVSGAVLHGVEVSVNPTEGSAGVTVTLLETESRKRHMRSAVAASKHEVAATIRKLCGEVLIPAEPAQADETEWGDADDLPF